MTRTPAVSKARILTATALTGAVLGAGALGLHLAKDAAGLSTTASARNAGFDQRSSTADVPAAQQPAAPLSDDGESDDDGQSAQGGFGPVAPPQGNGPGFNGGGPGGGSGGGGQSNTGGS